MLKKHELMYMEESTDDQNISRHQPYHIYIVWKICQILLPIFLQERPRWPNLAAMGRVLRKIYCYLLE